MLFPSFFFSVGDWIQSLSHALNPWSMLLAPIFLLLCCQVARSHHCLEEAHWSLLGCLLALFEVREQKIFQHIWNTILLSLWAAAQKGVFNFLYISSLGGTLPGNRWSSLGDPSHSGTIKSLPEHGWKCSKWTCSNFGQVWMCAVWGKIVYLHHSTMGLCSILWSEAESSGL